MTTSLSLLPSYLRLDVYEGKEFALGFQFFEKDGTTEKDISAYTGIQLQARHGRDDAIADVEVDGVVIDSDTGVKSVMSLPFVYASTFGKSSQRPLTYDVKYLDENGTTRTAQYGDMIIRPRSTF